MPIHFNLNPQKAVESLLWIIQRGEGNVYNIMKILFAADKYHLNKHARPVTGDKYVAMPFGTVPIWIYEATKLTGPGIGFTRRGNTLALESGRVFNRDKFSISDLEALEHGFAEYSGMSFDAVKQKNHDEPAWVLARNRNPDSEAPDILFDDILTNENFREDLELMAPYTVI